MLNSVSDFLSIVSDALDDFINDYIIELSVECQNCKALVFSRVIEIPISKRSETIIQRKCCSTDEEKIPKICCPECGVRICSKCGKCF